MPPRLPILVVASVGLLLACGPAPQATPPPGAGPAPASTAGSASTLDAIQKRGKLRVGLEAGYFPFEMSTLDGGFIGFDVEMAAHMAEVLGVELEIVNTEWDGIIPALQAGKFDIIMSGMTRTPKRALAVNFSDPYFETGQVILVNAEKGAEVADYRDLDKPDKTVAVKLGTTGDLAASKLLSQANLQKYSTEAEAAMEVNFGAGRRLRLRRAFRPHLGQAPPRQGARHPGSLHDRASLLGDPQGRSGLPQLAQRLPGRRQERRPGGVDLRPAVPEVLR